MKIIGKEQSDLSLERKAAGSRSAWSRLLLVLILLMAVGVRLAAAFYMGDTVEILPGTFDQLSYHRLTLRVLDGHGFIFGQRW